MEMKRMKLKRKAEYIGGYKSSKEDSQTMEKIYNGLIGLIVGDAIGAPVEFLERDSFHLTGMVGYGTHNVPPGTWTDDSSMALATAESIARFGRVDANDIMRNFALWLAKEEFTPYGVTFGVGNTTYNAIEKYLNGIPPLQCGGTAFRDNGNGALMRILPLAYTDCDEAVIDEVSGLTHAHEISKTACRIYIKIARGLLRGEDLRKLLKTMELERDEFRRLPLLASLTRDQINSSGYVVDTLEAALWSILHTRNYRNCILRAANLGGDTDTTCAVAGGLAGVLAEQKEYRKSGLQNWRELNGLPYYATILIKGFMIPESSSYACCKKEQDARRFLQTGFPPGEEGMKWK